MMRVRWTHRMPRWLGPLLRERYQFRPIEALNWMCKESALAPFINNGFGNVRSWGASGDWKQLVIEVRSEVSPALLTAVESFSADLGLRCQLSGGVITMGPGGGDSRKSVASNAPAPT